MSPAGLSGHRGCPVPSPVNPRVTRGPHCVPQEAHKGRLSILLIVLMDPTFIN